MPQSSQVRGQVRGQEDQLHAADEVRHRHHHERRVPQRHAEGGARALSPWPGDGGSGTLSTRPANQAAGSMISAERRRSRSTPARQPKPSVSAWPIGAASIAPSEPAAETMPSTVLRSATRHRARGRGHRQRRSRCRPAPAPMTRPAPSITPTAPLRRGQQQQAQQVAAARRRPSAGRKPQRAASAPATGCRKPQARFCTAMASVKSATEMPMSLRQPAHEQAQALAQPHRQAQHHATRRSGSASRVSGFRTARHAVSGGAVGRTLTERVQK